MASPKAILSAADYKNYRRVRAVSWCFIVLGGILVAGGISYALGLDPDKKPDLGLGIFVGVIGLTGVVGGVATLQGNRRWAWLVKVIAWIYLLGFPIGTILSFMLLDGYRRYFKSVDQLREADREEEEEESEMHPTE